MIKQTLKAIVISMFLVISLGCSDNKQEAEFYIEEGAGIELDGIMSEASWDKVEWRNIDQLWLGDEYDASDFQGRYKLLWDQNLLYVFAEIEDDTLVDIHADGLFHYWDDDCLEVFIDEDASKGDHQYNYNAFAYHISLDDKVVDIGPDSIPQYYDHLKLERRTDGTTSQWELAIQLYDDGYDDKSTNTPVTLKKGKQIGFAIAYCDNDRSPERENFIGSSVIEGEDKNRGWIDAGIFQTAELR